MIAEASGPGFMACCSGAFISGSAGKGAEKIRHAGPRVAWLSGFEAYRRLPLGRIRAALEGIGLLTILIVLISMSMMISFDGPDYEEYSSFWQGVEYVSTWLPGALLVYMAPLPFFVVAFNLLPAAGWRHLTGLALITCGYAAAAVLISGPTQFATDTLYVVVAICIVQEFRHRASLSAGQLVMQQINAANLDSRLTQARLQLLQAQIEPHFLFNTLANVRRLAQNDPVHGATMLGLLIRYIEAALPQLRADYSTLAGERALIEAYLSLYQIRMGQRLSYDIRIPEDLAAAKIPPMMLLTLIENSIKHGIDPLTQGGFILVSARQDGAFLELSVADSGRGMSTGIESGTGTGLANIRGRLQLLYGHAADIQLARGSARGITATLRLPLQRC
jgi:signal transduction histidine kinase